MFEPGDLIMYGNTGVCRVEEVATRKGVNGEPALHYRLTPLHDAGTIYTPVDTSVFMRPIISRQEAESLIAAMPTIAGRDCSGLTPRELPDRYQAALQTHRCEDLLVLLHTIYDQTQLALASGKKPRKVDLSYKKRAEELLHGELAAALGIAFEDVPAYIHAALGTPEEGAR